MISNIVSCSLRIACGAMLLVVPQLVCAMEIEPFPTFNQSPLVQIFGLPAAEPATTTAAGRLGVRLTVDMASNFAVDTGGNEAVNLDGETYRTTLTCRYGVGDRFEVGLAIPYLVTTGGVFDGPIGWWHRVFGIGQNGRDKVPEGQLIYSYERDGLRRVDVEGSGNGIGDLRLSAAYQLFRDDRPLTRAVALRAELKLPSGNSGELRGSGGTDFALWLSAADQYRLSHGHWGIFGSLGGMVVGRGDVLPELQRDLVAFGTVGLGWSPVAWTAVKVQLNGNTQFYHDSRLRELNNASVQLVFGESFALSRDTELHLAVSEDLLSLTTSPDFGLQLGIGTRF